MLKPGDKAPAFTLPDQNGNAVSLSDFLGKRVVLYFYPRDNTPGCTRQACAFKEAYDDFHREDVVVIGISKDSSASHRRFAEKYALPFLLLADPSRATLEAYGVVKEKTMYGKPVKGTSRTTFVIDQNGVVEAVFPDVSPDQNAYEVLSYLTDNA
ncbi:MAG TPA: thioredoxin-dependent thiol peroxidase [Clostridiales bacterium]|jgi:peroxiredoxin Q/BCP|nr:thioredoxin-dependent thiol peroxidase [Clostridiales bacterium]